MINFFIIVQFMMCAVITSVSGMDHIPVESKSVVPPLSILVAEDNEANQRVISRLLARHKVTLVTNGQEAVNAAENAKNRFDLFLTDIQMPIMDGREAAQIIRRLPNRKSMPIFALTASEEPELEKKCKDSGIDGILPKPISQTALEKVLLGVQESKLNNVEGNNIG